MDFVRLWFLATALVVVGGLIWSFAPILIPVIAITAGLGVLVAGIVGLARRIGRNRGMD